MTLHVSLTRVTYCGFTLRPMRRFCLEAGNVLESKAASVFQ